MPAKVETKKPFNPNLGSSFSNDAFGEGSILINITAENFDVLMKNVQVGSSILLKKNKVTSKGNTHYFTEILPPYQKKTKTAPTATASDLD